MAHGLSEKGVQLSSKKSEWKFVCWPINSQKDFETLWRHWLVEKLYPDDHGSPKLCKADQLHILELVPENPGIYLHELKLELQAQGTDVHKSTIYRFLQRANFTHKKMKLIAIQQNEELRAKYVAEISQYIPIC